MKTPLERAIAAGGGPSAFSRKLGISRSALWKWHLRPIPSGRVIQVEKLTGIPREELRPDLYLAPRPRKVGLPF